MILPAARPFLDHRDPESEWLGVAAHTGSENHGVLAGLVDRRKNRLQVVSWLVAEAYAGKGIGQALLSALETWAKSQGITYLSLTIRDNQSGFAATSHILEKRGWHGPQALVHRFKVAAATLQDLRWQHIPRPASELTVFPWSELSDAQRTALISELRDREQVPIEYLPTVIEQRFDALSVGVRLHDEIIGWLIAHRPKPDLVEYSTLYLKPAHRNTGASILLLAESFRHLGESGAQFVIFQVRTTNASMLRLTRRRFRPFVSEATLMRFEKDHGPGR